MVQQAESDIDLARANLLIAKEEYLDLNVEKYLEKLDKLAGIVRERVGKIREPLEIIHRMNQYLFEEEGFRGNTKSYYDPRNSFLNDVLDRKTGIPITLSTVYMEIGRRIELPIVGVGFPGHFLVKCLYENNDIVIDPFNKGAILSEEDCQARLDQVYGGTMTFQEHLLTAVTKKQMLTRMLQNLKGIYIQRQNYSKALSVVERILLIAPDIPNEIRDRGFLYCHLECPVQALADLERYIKMVPNAQDARSVQQNIQTLRKLVAVMN
jgi:regulator of sirC expression with transglutaminase-like and TPR domain